jgi:enoyl-[acyl-carrier protein] reductase I
MKPAWPAVAEALHVSAYSLKALAEATVGLMQENGGSIVGLDFDARFAWPGYNWMGVAKAALESSTRYLARDLGPLRVRVNLVAAGPVATLAARSIPGFRQSTGSWDEWAPLGWDATTADGIARTCVALFSDWLPMTTGEIIHADGGYHAVGPLGDPVPKTAVRVDNGSQDLSGVAAS